jgi:BirA family biotin operon repressor/biotin-[acetyl-CoA-carboxylase] ligase
MLNVTLLDEIDSTNGYAMRLINEGKAQHSQAISAKYQSAGKGMRGNEWHSEKSKNLLISIIITPHVLKAEMQFLIAQTVSLAILDFFSHFGIAKTEIKWPNDIYIDDKKAAGILIENVIKGQEIAYSIIGMGININQKELNSISKANSLIKILDKETDLDYAFELLIEKLNSRIQQLNSSVYDVQSDYHKNLYRLNEYYQYLIQNEPVVAKIIGVNTYGHLILSGIYGQTYTCAIKEIVFL